ncbi:uncharacterized protein N7477_008991 [Penicillium maclennaniae]|uniref:uncharacterized protein n=1 Tax=Penicillium maclennaniae TaxID=1343394 RepID=UPI002541D303|nr:uncharacterized protein N7477_008991 [Penicillium maclennaniae]KAJ5666543.1 hypothetical protein N7477_008991 [Penicillium maclennaniae]
MKALVSACIEFTEKCYKDQRSWNDEMQSSAEDHRSRQAAIEKKLAIVEAALANLMSRMVVMEGNTDETGEHSGKANPKKNRK